MSGHEERVRALIYRASRFLDDEEWDNFLNLCTPDFRYRVTAFSPELRKKMLWFDHDRESLKPLFDMVPQHLRRLGTLLRHVSVGTIDSIGGDGTMTMVSVVSTFQCTHTDHEGRSHLLAVGRYFDTVDVGGPAPLIKARETYLETRDLGIGSHVPL